MSTWNQPWPAGTEVRVVECLQNGKTKYLGEGYLANHFMPGSDPAAECSLVIRMNNGRLLHGHECWWVPVDVLREDEMNFIKESVRFGSAKLLD